MTGTANLGRLQMHWASFSNPSARGDGPFFCQFNERRFSYLPFVSWFNEHNCSYLFTKPYIWNSYSCNLRYTIIRIQGVFYRHRVLYVGERLANIEPDTDTPLTIFSPPRIMISFTTMTAIEGSLEYKKISLTPISNVEESLFVDHAKVPRLEPSIFSQRLKQYHSRDRMVYERRLPFQSRLRMDVRFQNRWLIITSPSSRQYPFIILGPRNQTSPTVPGGTATSLFIITISLTGVGSPL